MLRLLITFLIAPAFAGALSLLHAGDSFFPVWQCDFRQRILCQGVTVNSPALNGLVLDATGVLTYKGNNLVTSSGAGVAGWTKSVGASIATGVSDPTGGTNAVTFTNTTGTYQYIFTQPTGIGGAAKFISTYWLRCRVCTGSVQIADSSNTNHFVSPTASWQRFTTGPAGPMDATHVDATVVLQSVGDQVDVYFPTVSAVTYETTTRAVDTVGGPSDNAYFGPGFSYGQGLNIWEARTNLFLNSAVGATQSVTTSATPYTLSCFGTGTITLTGTSTAGPLTCAGTASTPVPATSLTFTPSAGTLTLTVSGSATYVNLEQSSFPGPRILTGSSGSVYASPDSVMLTGTPVTVMETANFSAISEAVSTPGNGWVIGNGPKTVSNLNVLFQGQSWQGGALLTTSNATSANATFRVGSSFSSSGRSLVLNGGTVATDSSTTYATGQTYYLGSNVASSSFIDGYICSVAVYNKRLADTLLQSKSIVGAPY